MNADEIKGLLNGYLKEINNPIKPMDRPLNVSSAGRKLNPSITSKWGLK